MGQSSEKVGARWRALMAEQQQSGRSVAAFCRERGLRDDPFYGWKKRLQQTQVSPFVAVEIAAMETTATPLPVVPMSSVPIEIRSRYGRSVSVRICFQLPTS